MPSSNDRSEKRPNIEISVDTKLKNENDLIGQIRGDISTRLSDLADETDGGYNHTVLAKSMGIDRSNVSRLLSRPGKMTVSKLAQIASNTGSRIHLRMIEEPDSEFHRKLNMVSYYEHEERAHPRRKGLSLRGLLADAKIYIDNTINEARLLKNTNDLKVSILETEEFFGIEPEEFEELEEDAANTFGILVENWDSSLQHTRHSSLFIAPEFTFNDGHSETEWVIYDRLHNEHFRNRDLRQVAQLCGIMLSRGGETY